MTEGDSLIWEWIAPSGDKIVARLDPADGFESVYLGPRLVSRSPIGAKPEGHAIPARAGAGNEGYRQAAATLVVLYDIHRGAFDLRANGQLVAPSTRPPSLPPPARGAPRMAPPPMQYSDGAGGGGSVIMRVLIGAFAILLLGGGVVAVVRRLGKPTEPPAGEMTSQHRLVRFHYPAGFKPKPEKVEEGGGQRMMSRSRNEPIISHLQSSLIYAGHYQNDEGVFVLSVKTNDANIGRDPWVVSNYVHASFAQEIRDKLLKERASVTENSREEMTCLGEPGAVVDATFTAGGETGRFWTCTFLHDGNAFMIGYFVNQKIAADEPVLRQILDRTELLAN